jgi:hypothetical protein
VPTFADSQMVSAADPYGRNRGFLDLKTQNGDILENVSNTITFQEGTENLPLN